MIQIHLPGARPFPHFQTQHLAGEKKSVPLKGWKAFPKVPKLSSLHISLAIIGHMPPFLNQLLERGMGLFSSP